MLLSVHVFKILVSKADLINLIFWMFVIQCHNVRTLLILSHWVGTYLSSVVAGHLICSVYYSRHNT